MLPIKHIYNGKPRLCTQDRIDSSSCSRLSNFDHLQSCLRDAKRHGYALGVKLVRGAYHTQEQAAASGVVWTQKSETDECYAKCVSLILSSIQDDISKGSRSSSPQAPSVGVLFGTHNWDSCRQILRELVERKMADDIGSGVISISQPVAERLQIAQLYGEWLL